MAQKKLANVCLAEMKIILVLKKKTFFFHLSKKKLNFYKSFDLKPEDVLLDEKS